MAVAALLRGRVLGLRAELVDVGQARGAAAAPSSRRSSLVGVVVPLPIAESARSTTKGSVAGVSEGPKRSASWAAR